MKKKIIFGLVLCALLSVMGIRPVKDVKAADSYTKEQITKYITDREYPTEEGKVFAGWYNGETPVKSIAEVTDDTRPKFVDDDVLTMKFQLLAVTTSTSTTTDVRFLTSVDSLNYKSVEFEVTLNKTITTPVNKVYTSVNAEGEKFTPKEVFSEDSNYIATLLMTDFTKESSDSDEYGYWGKTITVTPKWTTMDGTTVTGKTRQIEVNDGLYDTEVNSGSTRTWHSLTDGIAKVNKSTEDVSIDLLQDVTHKSQIKINVTNNQSGTITINGNGHTLTGAYEGDAANAPHFIYFEKHFGTVNLNNLKIVHTNTAKNLMTFGSSSTNDITQTMVVNLKDVTMESYSTNAYSIINIPQVTNFDITLDHVTLNWKTESVANAARAAIRYGDEGKDKTVNLVIKNESILNMSEAVGSGIVYSKTGFNDDSAISVLDSKLTPYAEQYAYKGDAYKFEAAIYVSGKGYFTLDDAVTAANASEEDVTIKFLTDVTYSTNITINNVKGNKITIDGCGKNLKPNNAVIFIYQKSGSVEVKNMVVTDYKKNILFRIGDKDSTESYALTVNLENIDITSESNNPLIQAGHTTMNLDLNMKDVKLLSWTTTSEITTGAIMIGTNGEPTVNLKMEDCSFDVSGATGSAKAIYANDKASGTINLINTKITSNGDSVFDNNMKFTRDEETELSTYPTTQVQMGDAIYNELFEAVEDANKSQDDVTISFISDTVTFDENVDIANTNGKTITIEGCNKALQPKNAAIRIYQKTGLVEVKNTSVADHTQNLLFRIGDKEKNYSKSDKLTVNLENLEITTSSNQKKGLIQAGYGAMQLDLNMKNVDLVWQPNGEYAKGAITIGCADISATATVNLTMTDCTLDVSEATNGCAIYVEDNATGAIQLIDTNLIAVGGSVYNNNIPVYDVNKAATVLFEGSQFCEVLIEDVAAQEFARYTETLEERGFTEHSTKKIDNAEYGVYTNDEMALYVNQFDSAMRIVYSDIDTAFLPETEQSDFDKVCDTTGYMVGVTAGKYENGMCFIYLLADGTFLVYDGGRNEADADHLYELLQRIATENGIDEVVISNWMLTHAHGDHSGCLKEFFAKYADSVEIQRVMFNPSHPNLSVDVDRTEEKRVLNAIRNYSPNTKIVRLHSGQEFWLADMKVEVLYTIEDLAPSTSDDYNDTSTITRLTINGKTILMTGDAATDVWELMCTIYGDALKSDYLQVPHHGTDPGGTTDAYDKIQPTYLLWPCGENLYRDNLGLLQNWYTNKHLLNMVDSKNSYIAGVYDATNNTERITEFPISE